MRTDTEKRIEEFRRFPWFQNVGQPKSEEVLSVHTWVEAMSYCKTAEWESVQLQVNNQLAVSVNRTDYTRFQQWNPTVARINAKLKPIIKEHVLPVALENRLGKRFEDSVSWDLMEVCIETEFSDICQPIFFLKRVLPWYQSGHFPCGWQGAKINEDWDGIVPDGRLIVF